MNKTLPEGWIEIKLLELVLNKKGKKPKQFSNILKDGFLPYIDIKAFEKSEITKYGEINSSSLINRNDILVVWDGARFGFVGKVQEGAAGSTIMIITPCIIDSIYTYYFLQHKYPYINSNPKGTGIPHVNPEIFWNMPIPLPPLAEQKRIAAKLDAGLPHIENLKERLENAKELIKQFRQSVLNAAVTGKLSEEWREKNQDIGGWIIGEFSKFCDIIPGYAFSSRDFIKKGIEVVKIANIQYGLYEDSINQEYLPLSFLDKHSRFIVRKNDILMALTRPITNDTLKVCLFPKGRGIALLNQRVSLIKPYRTVSKNYLLLFMQSENFKNEVRSNLSETLQPNLSPKDLAKIIINLPSFEEQCEIIRRVEKLFGVADKLEARLYKINQYVEDLGKSELVKAFRGELVPTEAELAEKEGRSYETAEELLERIKAEKNKLEEERKGKKGCK